MLFRLIFFLLILCTACRSGEIACPKVKVVKLRKTPFNWRIQQSSVSARSNNHQEPESKPKERVTKVRRPSDTRKVTDVSVEEWDCPRTTTAKYMPRAVKKNIRKNMKKIQDPEKSKNEADSVTQVIPTRSPN